MATLDAIRREKVVQTIKEYDGLVGEMGSAVKALRPGGLR
jgi:hypothetical protein